MDGFDSAKSVVAFVTSLGGTGVLVVVGWALWTNRLFLPRDVKWRDDLIQKLEAARDKWQDTAIRSLQNNERLLNTNEKVVAVAQSLPPPTAEARP